MRVEMGRYRGLGLRPILSAALNHMSLFKKLDPKADLGTPSSLKSSVQRGIRTKLLEQYADTLGADDGALLEKIWPKKEPVTSAKFKCVTRGAQALTQARACADPFAEKHAHLFPALRRAVPADAAPAAPVPYALAADPG